MSQADKCIKGFPCKLSCIPRNHNCLGKLSDRENKNIKAYSSLIEKIYNKETLAIDVEKLEGLEPKEKSKALLILDITGNLPDNLSPELLRELEIEREKERQKRGLKYNPRGEAEFKDRIDKMENSILDKMEALIRKYPEGSDDILKYLTEKLIDNPNSFKDNQDRELLLNILEEKYRYDSLVNAYVNLRLTPKRKNRKDEMTPEGFQRYEELYQLDDIGNRLEDVLPNNLLDKEGKGKISPSGTEKWLKNRQDNLIKIQILESVGIEITKDNLKKLDINLKEDELSNDADVLYNLTSGLNQNNGDPNKPSYGSRDSNINRGKELVIKQYLRQGGLDIHDGSPMNLNECSVEHIFPNGARKNVLVTPEGPDGYYKIGNKIVGPIDSKELENKVQEYLDSPPNVGLSREKINKIKSGYGGDVFDEGIQKNKIFNVVNIPKLLNNAKHNKNDKTKEQYINNVSTIINKLSEMDNFSGKGILKEDLIEYIKQTIYSPKGKLYPIREYINILNNDTSINELQKNAIIKALNIQLNQDYLEEKKPSSIPANYNRSSEINEKTKDDIEYMNQVVLNPLFYGTPDEIKADIDPDFNSTDLLDFLKDLRFGINLEKPLESNESAAAVLQVLGIARGFSDGDNNAVADVLMGNKAKVRRANQNISTNSMDLFKKILDSDLPDNDKIEYIKKIGKLLPELVGGSSSLRAKLEKDNSYYDGSLLKSKKDLAKEIGRRRQKLYDITGNALLELSNPLDKIDSILKIDPQNIIEQKPNNTQIDSLLSLMSNSNTYSEIANNPELLNQLAFLLGTDSIMFKLIYSYKTN